VGEPFYKLLQGDCLEVLPTLTTKSVDCIIADLPYNINADKWDNIENYIDWLKTVFKEFRRILKDNGSLYWFHSEMKTVSEMMVYLEKETDFVFRQFIVWNKRFEGSKNKGYLDGFLAVEELRNYQQMAEYILFYTLQDETGLSKIYSSPDTFQSLRDYFKTEKLKTKLTNKQFNLLFSKYYKKEGCIDRSVIEHYFGINQWCLPTKEIYEEILQKTGYFQRRYEDLRKEYEDLRYTFNNQKTHHSIWNYDISTASGHNTPKPIELIKNILRHSTKVNDVVLDPTAGSGVVIKACKDLQRNCIAIEKSEKYCGKMKNQIINQTNFSHFEGQFVGVNPQQLLGESQK
jgi:site-specific DNA-methyltransferase (adenine-specific)